MPTFLLRKYNQEDSAVNNAKNNEAEKNKDENASDELTITVTGSVSEIVANALNKVFANKAEVKKIDEEKDSSIKVISTENINNSPLDTFNFIHKNNVVLILNKGFRTRAEEWFLTNIENKTNNVYYTLESFIKFIKNKLQIE